MSGRISTGIPGLDRMLGGGLFSGRVYLVRGEPGLGKTTLGIQFLMEGVRRGEDVMYITMEEPLSMVKEDMKSLGFDLENPHFHGIDATPVRGTPHIFATVRYDEFGKSFERFIQSVEDVLKEEKATRIVVDPISMLRLTTKDELDYHNLFIKFLKLFLDYDTTVVITSGTTPNYGDIEDYLTSGVILLRRFLVNNKVVKGIQILKFRGSMFDEDIRPYSFTERGIKVYDGESLYVG